MTQADPNLCRRADRLDPCSPGFLTPARQQRRSRSPLAPRSDRSLQEPQRFPPLQSQAAHHRQHPFHERLTARSLVPIAALAPDHRGAQRPLCRVVRRLYSFHRRERPQALATPQQLPRQARCRLRLAAPCPSQPAKESRLDRSQTLLQLPALDLTAHESVPKPEHGVCHLQRQRSVRAAAVLAFDGPRKSRNRCAQQICQEQRPPCR
jgi:hypothetical protein